MRNKYRVDKVAQHCNTIKKEKAANKTIPSQKSTQILKIPHLTCLAGYRKMTKYRKIVHVKNYQHRNTANFLILMG